MTSSLPSKQEFLDAIQAARLNRLSTEGDNLKHAIAQEREMRLFAAYMFSHGGLADDEEGYRDVTVDAIIADDMFVYLLESVGSHEPIDSDEERDGLIDMVRNTGSRETSLEVKLALAGGEANYDLGRTPADVPIVFPDFVAFHDMLRRDLRQGVSSPDSAVFSDKLGLFAQEAVERLIQYVLLFFPYKVLKENVNRLLDVRKIVQRARNYLKSGDSAGVNNFMKMVNPHFERLPEVGEVYEGDRGVEEIKQYRHLPLEVSIALYNSVLAHFGKGRKSGEKAGFWSRLFQ